MPRITLRGGLPFRSCLVSLVAFSVLSPSLARADDPLPIIVTYELKKARLEERIIARNPRAFWIRQIVARIEDKKQDLLEPLKEPVTVQVTFVVGRDGHVVSKVVSKPSGVAEADQIAMVMLERAQPFPPMPAGMDDKELTFNLPVRIR